MLNLRIERCLFGQVPPSIESSRQRAITVNEGDIASLPCNSQGYPPPKISWIHDGRTMIHDDDQHQIQQSGTLTIANVQVWSTDTRWVQNKTKAFILTWLSTLLCQSQDSFGQHSHSCSEG